MCMCNCMENTRKRLEDDFKNKEEFKDLTNFRVINENMAMIFEEDNTIKSTPYIAYIATGNYTTKTGKTRKKRIPLNVVFKYCPFCGEKIDE